MSEERQEASWRGRVVMVGVFLLVFGWFADHVWRNIDPRLLFYQHCPIFLTDVDYLKTFLDRPAGLAEYASLFLAQSYVLPWVGVAVIAGLGALVWWATWGLVRVVRDAPTPLPMESGPSVGVPEGHPAACYVPALLLVMLHNRYDYKLITTVALLVSLGLANAYLRIPWRSTWVRWGVYVLLGGVVYDLAGGMVVLFGAVCATHELLKNRRWIPAAACLAIAAAIPLGYAMYSYEVTVTGAYAPLVPFLDGFVSSYSAILTVPARPSTAWLSLPSLLRLALFCSFPLVMVWVVHGKRLIAVVARRLRRRSPSPSQGEGGGEGGRIPTSDVFTLTPTLPLKEGGGCPPRPARLPGPTPAEGLRPTGGWTAISLAVFLIIVVTLTSWSLDTVQKRRLQVGWYAQQGKWEETLYVARMLSPVLHDSWVIFDVNRALYHTGRLPSKMFCYPQKQDADGLFLYGIRARTDVLTYLKSSTIFYELGHVNYVQMTNQIALETFGERPEILQRLIRLNVAAGRVPVARCYLRALRRNMLFRRWAEDFLARLDMDPTMASDEEVARLRACNVTKDYGATGMQRGSDYEEKLTQLLEANPKNRMAFEYLMAHYLLTNKLDKIVANLGRLADFDYVDIPTHYEEAVLLYEQDAEKPRPDLHGRQISPEGRERLLVFMQSYEPCQKARGAEQVEMFVNLVRYQSLSYFFYYHLGFSVAPLRITLGRLDTYSGATRRQVPTEIR